MHLSKQLFISDFSYIYVKILPVRDLQRLQLELQEQEEHQCNGFDEELEVHRYGLEVRWWENQDLSVWSCPMSFWAQGMLDSSGWEVDAPLHNPSL
jgi:hypothetical protein